jgi:hypothetical protein
MPSEFRKGLPDGTGEKVKPTRPVRAGSKKRRATIGSPARFDLNRRSGHIKLPDGSTPPDGTNPPKPRT